ncbi:MAG: (R)-hydratase [Mycobacteriaceae bacterium]|nr:(R)-hydratase [Mycobacteriaceae bacterium]
MGDHYEVGREKIREFARAVQDFHPAHWDDAAARELGYPGLVAPVTFASATGGVLQRDMFRAALPDYAPSRLLHVEQELRCHRPVVAGDRLLYDVTVDSRRELAGGDIIVVSTAISDVDTGPVQSVHTTLIGRRGDPARDIETLSMPERPIPLPTESDAAPVPRRRYTPRRPRPAAAGDISAGRRFPARSYRLARGDLVNYAGVSGDNNPIHWNDAAALAAGMSSVVAHGMLTMGMAAGYLSEFLSDPGAVTTLAVHFANPVLVDTQRPAEITFTGAAIQAAPESTTIALTAHSTGVPIYGNATATINRELPE